MRLSDEEIMRLALAEAAQAEAHEDVPIGAVVVAADGTILAKAGNRREKDRDPTAHAEVLALREAAERHGHWNLTGASLYVTLEPCPMCAGAAVLGRIKQVVYGTSDPKGGAISLGIEILGNPRLNHRPEVRGGVLAEEAKTLLQNFFKKKRIS